MSFKLKKCETKTYEIWKHLIKTKDKFGLYLHLNSIRMEPENYNDIDIMEITDVIFELIEFRDFVLFNPNFDRVEGKLSRRGDGD